MNGHHATYERKENQHNFFLQGKSLGDSLLPLPKAPSMIAEWYPALLQADTKNFLRGSVCFFFFFFSIPTFHLICDSWELFSQSKHHPPNCLSWGSSTPPAGWDSYTIFQPSGIHRVYLYEIFKRLNIRTRQQCSGKTTGSIWERSRVHILGLPWAHWATDNVHMIWVIWDWGWITAWRFWVGEYLSVYLSFRRDKWMNLKIF